MPFNSAAKSAIAPAITPETSRLCLQARQAGLPDAIVRAAQRVGLALAERAGDAQYQSAIWAGINLVAPSLQFIARAIRIEVDGAPWMTDAQDQRAGTLCIAIAEQLSRAEVEA